MLRKVRIGPSQQCLQAMPSKTEPWVLLAARRDVLVTGHVRNRVMVTHSLAEVDQLCVLCVFENIALEPL